jgi:hypothetical protein
VRRAPFGGLCGAHLRTVSHIRKYAGFGSRSSLGSG